MRIFSCGGGGNLTLGYIENKRVNADLAELINKSNTNPREQIAKYLTLSDNLILTDYLRFLRVAKAPNGKIHITQEITLCALDQIHSTLKSKSTLESKQSELLEFFALFFSSAPKPINTAQEFALCLAQRTKLVKDTLIDNPQNPQIATLYQSFKDILYKDLDFPTFCDSFAQTLTYALFLARLNDERGEMIDLYNVKKFIPKSFPLIRAMSGFLDNLDELDSLKWLIKEILGIINHIDPASITKELNKIAQKDLLGNYLHKDPYLHFYETFLSQYDPHLRELRGVYYTPFAVVSFIINAIDSTLKRDFNQTKGLGSALNNDNITLLDFATGTGTFLLEAFRKALDSTPPNSLHYKPKNLLSKFSGFEFLIAPYTIAHLKISQSFKEEFHTPLEDNEKLNILLTNTLYDKSEKDERNEQMNLFTGMIELANEFLESQKVKNNNILIITGNPPYNYDSINEYDYIYTPKDSKPKKLSKIQAHYFYCGVQENADKGNRIEPIYINEKNPKGLQDDYVKFIRFAESKIAKQENGIIAIISNNGFIDNPTFRGMRWHLLNTFDKIYILDLHGNARKKEKALDGSKDDNVFDIMQGVCISIFVKTNNQNKPTPPIIKVETPPLIKWETYSNAPKCKVYHYDLYGKRKDKYDFLQSNGLDSIAWSAIAPKAPFYLFIPQNESLRAQYDKGISIKDIFSISSVGIVTSKDSILIAPNEQILESRIREHYGEFDKKFVQDIAYRPFDIQKVYYDSIKIGRTRYEVMKHFLDNEISPISCEAESKSPLPCGGGLGVGIKTDKSPNHRPLAPYMKEFSRVMRKNPTQAENKLWQELRGKKLGFGFRRQFVIDSKYIADFVCLEKRLIIECDGGQHSKSPLPCGGDLGVGKDTLNHPDIQRDFYLESQNFRILRFWNNEILGNLEGVLSVIKEALGSNADFANAKSTHPLAPSAREGECVESPRTNEYHKREFCNIGLVYDKGCNLREINNFFITNHIADKHLNGASGYISPLYLVETDSLVENLTPQFRAFIDTKYGQRFEPEVILGYIYAVLFHKDYREKFLDFLKIDFPRIPFVKSKEQFLALSALGEQIIALHLMRGEIESITEPLFDEPQNRNERIEKIAYNAEQKRLYVNESLYFSNVSEEVWGYKIGGYAVCEKYLKSHKGEILDYAHFERIITTLHESLRVESQIAKIALE